MTALDQLIATTPSEERVNLLGMTRVQLEAFFLDLGGEALSRAAGDEVDSPSGCAGFF